MQTCFNKFFCFLVKFEKLQRKILQELVKDIPSFCGIGKFITALERQQIGINTKIGDANKISAIFLLLSMHAQQE